MRAGATFQQQLQEWPSQKEEVETEVAEAAVVLTDARGTVQGDITAAVQNSNDSAKAEEP